MKFKCQCDHRWTIDITELEAVNFPPKCPDCGEKIIRDF
jgi:predicted RNA-binding Zn-ribbon protein involved in translation (DUF1610 family)